MVLSFQLQQFGIMILQFIGIMVVPLVFGAIHTFNLVFTNIQQLRMEHSQDGNDLGLKHVHLNTSELVQHNATGIVGKHL